MVQERFQRSGLTISRVFNKVLDAIMMLYPSIVTQPNGDTVLFPQASILQRIRKVVCDFVVCEVCCDDVGVNDGSS